VIGSLSPRREPLRHRARPAQAARALLLSTLLGVAPAAVQEGAATSSSPGDHAAESAGERPAESRVDLDRLLRLPDSVEYDVEERGGATADEWRGRFRRARQEVAAARERVQRAQEELRDEASSESAWNVAPPGLGAVSQGSSEGTSNYKLSMALRRAKEDLARAERALRQLTVEANLAGVPESWRQ